MGAIGSKGRSLNRPFHLFKGSATGLVSIDESIVLGKNIVDVVDRVYLIM